MPVFTQCRRKREPKLFLLLRGLVGNVVVVYNQPNGQRREYHAGTRVYRVPSGGIVYSQFSPNHGVGLPTEYRYTDAGTRSGKSRICSFLLAQNKAYAQEAHVITHRHAS
jgi:hypothetical protein